MVKQPEKITLYYHSFDEGLSLVDYATTEIKHGQQNQIVDFSLRNLFFGCVPNHVPDGDFDKSWFLNKNNWSKESFGGQIGEIRLWSGAILPETVKELPVESFDLNYIRLYSSDNPDFSDYEEDMD